MFASSGGALIAFAKSLHVKKETQIVVPMIEVIWVDAPNFITARQVGRQVTTSLGKLLTKFTGLEMYIFQTSLDGKLSVILRFMSVEDREEPCLNTHINKKLSCKFRTLILQ